MEGIWARSAVEKWKAFMQKTEKGRTTIPSVFAVDQAMAAELAEAFIQEDMY